MENILKIGLSTTLATLLFTGCMSSSCGNNPSKFDSIFEKYSKIYGINKDFIKKIAILESNLDETRVTTSFNKNDNFVGLFQLSEKFFNVDSKNIDNEDITNKAVKLMRDCVDKKEYTIEAINCFNKSYTDDDKKILLSLLKQENLSEKVVKRQDLDADSENYKNLIYKTIGIDKYNDAISKRHNDKSLVYSCPYSTPSQIVDMPFFPILDFENKTCTTYNVYILKNDNYEFVPDYTKLKEVIDSYLENNKSQQK